MSEQRQCTRCNHTKPLDEFYTTKGEGSTEKIYHKRICKQCDRIDKLARNKQRREQRKARKPGSIGTTIQCGGCNKTKPADQFFLLNTLYDKVCKKCRLTLDTREPETPDSPRISLLLTRPWYVPRRLAA